MTTPSWNPLVPELTVSDLDRSLGLYTALLGFTVRFQRDNPPFAYLDLGGAQLMLEQWHPSGWQTGELTPPFGRGVNFQIEVADVAIIVARLEAANIILFRPVQDTWYATNSGEEGQREFLVQDPDGYLLRFAQPLGTRPAEII